MIAAILTGGRARRFHGRDKSRLVVDGRPILERQLEAIGPAVSDILIVTSADRADAFDARPGPPPVRIVLDRYPGTGPLGAVVTALDEPGGAAADAVLVVAGDMPGVTIALIEALVTLHRGAGAAVTVPATARGLEPLCAIYARRSAAPLRAALASGARSLQIILPGLQPAVLTADAVARIGDPVSLFANINAPGDLPH